jgi:hypothetical protein
MKRITPKKRKTVQITLWVKPGVKSELERIAKTEGLSLSQTGGSFLEEAIRQKLHIQHTVLLQPIIEEAIRKEIAKYCNRLALLLVRVAFDVGIVRGLTVRILRRQRGVSDEVLNDMLDKSVVAAKGNITRKTPQLQTVLDEVSQWFKGEERTVQSNG